MSKSQRAKGASGEREVCAILSTMFSREIKRHLGQARDSGEDIDLGWGIVEVKRRKTLTGLYNWMTQALCAAQQPGTSAYGRAMLAVRADGERWLFVCDLENLMNISAKLEQERLLG